MSLLLVSLALSAAFGNEFALKEITIDTLYRPLVLKSPRVEYAANEEFGLMPTFKAEIFAGGEDKWISISIACRLTGTTVNNKPVSRSIMRLLPTGVRESRKPLITASEPAIITYRFMPDDRFDMLKSGQILCETTNGEQAPSKGQKNKYEEERIAAREAEYKQAEAEAAALSAKCRGLRKRFANTKVGDLTVSQSEALAACRALGL